MVERIKVELIQLLSLPENVKMDYNAFNEQPEIHAPIETKTLQKYSAGPSQSNLGSISGGRGGFKETGSKGGYDGYIGGHSDGRGQSRGGKGNFQ